MGSTRFPGKALVQVAGRPLLDYVLRNVERIPSSSSVVVATSISKADDAIEDYLAIRGTPCFRGSEEDVLERFVQAARAHRFDVIVRITGDSPLVDPDICESFVARLRDEGADLVHNGPTFAEGLDCEVLTIDALERANEHARLKSEREHVTVYIHNRKSEFKVVTVENDRDDGAYRFTVDEPEDLRVFEHIVGHFGSEDPISYREVVDYLQNNNSVARINNWIVRNEGYHRSLAGDGVVDAPDEEAERDG